MEKIIHSKVASEFGIKWILRKILFCLKLQIDRILNEFLQNDDMECQDILSVLFVVHEPHCSKRSNMSPYSSGRKTTYFYEKNYLVNESLRACISDDPG